VRVSGLTVYTCNMPFVIKGVPAEKRYGFKINNVLGEIFMSNVGKLVTLTVGGSSASLGRAPAGYPSGGRSHVPVGCLADYRCSWTTPRVQS